MTAEQERGLWGHAQMYRVATSDIQENGLNGLNSSYKGLCLYVDAMIAAAVAAELLEGIARAPHISAAPWKCIRHPATAPPSSSPRIARPAAPRCPASSTSPPAPIL